MISFSCKLRETLTAAASSLAGSFPVDWLSGFARRIRTLHTSAFTVHSDLAGAVDWYQRSPSRRVPIHWIARSVYQEPSAEAASY